jgi:hypothetical protein
MPEPTEALNQDKTQNQTQNHEDKNEEKKFSQQQVNEIVSSRINEVKSKFADYETLKVQASKVDSLNTETAKKTEELNKVTETLTTTLNSFLEKIPENKRTLIPDELTVAQKVTYISKNMTILMDSDKIVPVKINQEVANPKKGEETILKGIQNVEDLSNPTKVKEQIAAYNKRKQEGFKIF